MRVRLLGPVDVTVDGVPRPVPGLRRKAVLAVLALRRGEIVSTDQLVDVVWGDRAPATAVNTLQSHVSHLRHVLDSKSAILARSPGYVLALDAGGTDIEVAENLIHDAAQSTDQPHRLRQLRSALALWRGRPLLDVAGLTWLDEQAHRLDQLWLQANRALVDTRLALGEHAQLIPDLQRLTRDHPFDEQLHGQLMLALYRAGRQADALAAFHRLRQSLDDDLGIEPGQPLRDLEAAILRQDAGLDPTPPAITVPAEPAAPPTVPAQLPPAVHAFAGRDEALARLDAILPETDTSDPAGQVAVVISALSGTAGVGKTTLAVHWAHRVAARFPDGQLYVNLRGFDPGGQALDPAEAVRGFLDAFGVPVDRIPAGLPARSALYRSRLAGKRVLVLLDNARDAEQVRPLLPGSARCLVLVTSRNQLTGLVAAEGARPLVLDLLPVAEARALLARRLGADRVAAEPDAVAEIISRCARLPLALAIAAARAAHQPGFSLATIAGELRAAAGGLDALAGADTATDVRAVFSWSYRTLGADAARLFRLLGLHPGPDIAVSAAASLAGAPVRRTRELLAELVNAHLVAEHRPGRYSFHDLLRAYAVEQVREHDSDDERRAAIHRLLDHYLHTAYAAVALLDPHRLPVALAPAQPGVTVAELEDSLTWFAAEHQALLAVVDRAVSLGFDVHAWQIAANLVTFFDRQGHWHDQLAVQGTALLAALRLGDLSGQAYAQRGLGLAAIRLGRLDDGESHYQRALRLSIEDGDRDSQARAHLTLAWLSERQARHADAINHSEQALGLYLDTGHRAGQARALNSIGWNHAHLGDHEKALSYCEQALPLQQGMGDRSGEANTWESLGDIYRRHGDHRQAAACYRRALDLYQKLGERYNEGTALIALGDSLAASGAPDAARDAWRSALDILDRLAHPDADVVRAKLKAHPA